MPLRSCLPGPIQERMSSNYSSRYPSLRVHASRHGRHFVHTSLSKHYIQTTSWRSPTNSCGTKVSHIQAFSQRKSVRLARRRDQCSCRRPGHKWRLGPKISGIYVSPIVGFISVAASANVMSLAATYILCWSTMGVEAVTQHALDCGFVDIAVHLTRHECFPHLSPMCDSAEMQALDNGYR